MRGKRGKRKRRQERKGRGRGRRDNLTKLKGSAISEKQQERRQADVEEDRDELVAGVNSLLALHLLLSLFCLFVCDWALS